MPTNLRSASASIFSIQLAQTAWPLRRSANEVKQLEADLIEKKVENTHSFPALLYAKATEWRAAHRKHLRRTFNLHNMQVLLLAIVLPALHSSTHTLGVPVAWCSIH